MKVGRSQAGPGRVTPEPRKFPSGIPGRKSGEEVKAIAFEMAKVATTVYLISNFRFRLVPILLSVALVCLVGISSIGIYGYLGKAYNEGRAEVVIGAGAIQVLQQEVVALEQERDHNAIVRLSARRRPTESEKYRAQRRFVSSIQREIKRKKNRNRAYNTEKGIRPIAA